MLPVLSILEEAVSYESKRMIKSKRKVDGLTNTLARQIIKSKSFKKIDSTENSVTYEYVDPKHRMNVWSISIKKNVSVRTVTLALVLIFSERGCAHI